MNRQQRARNQRRRHARRCKRCRKMFGGGGIRKPEGRYCPSCTPLALAQDDVEGRDWVDWMVGEPGP